MNLNYYNVITAVIIIIISLCTSFLNGSGMDSVKELKKFFDLHVNTNVFTNIVISPCFTLMYKYLIGNCKIMEKFDNIVNDVVKTEKNIEYYYIFLIFLKVCALIKFNTLIYQLFSKVISLFFEETNIMLLFFKIGSLALSIHIMQSIFNTALKDFESLKSFLIKFVTIMLILLIAVVLLIKSKDKLTKKLSEKTNIDTEEIDEFTNKVKIALKNMMELFFGVLQMIGILFGISCALQVFFIIYNKIFRKNSDREVYMHKDTYFVKIIYMFVSISILIYFLLFRV